MPVICMQLSYVNLIVLVWISCITGQTPDRYYGWGGWQVSDYMGSVWCLLLKESSAGQATTGSKRVNSVSPSLSLVCSALFAGLGWLHFKRLLSYGLFGGRLKMAQFIMI